eukprot:751156-Prorocentrum_lima.AAC.1
MPRLASAASPPLAPSFVLGPGEEDIALFPSPRSQLSETPNPEIISSGTYDGLPDAEPGVVAPHLLGVEAFIVDT